MELSKWEWNEQTCNGYLNGTNRHGPDYREVLTDVLDLVEHPMDSALYITLWWYKGCQYLLLGLWDNDFYRAYIQHGLCKAMGL